MDDVIYRQDAIDAIKLTSSPYLVEIYDTYQAQVKALRDLPSAQKKGNWRNYEGTLTCSVCETEIDSGIMEYCGDDVPMFCPNCGADMRGDDDE